MAIIKCPECKKEISDTTDTCIHCGYKLKKQEFDYKELLKLGIPIVLVFILKKPILYMIYYIFKFLGLNTSSHLVGTYLYVICHVGIMVLLFYLLYKKILKIKNNNYIIIALIAVAFLTLMTAIILPSNKSTTNEEDIVDTEEELEKCSNKGYFINQVQAEIYSTYNGYKNIILTGCSASPDDGWIEVKCKFRSQLTSESKVQDNSMTRRYNCKK